jgi:hypothetical protein
MINSLVSWFTLSLRMHVQRLSILLIRIHVSVDFVATSRLLASLPGVVLPVWNDRVCSVIVSMVRRGEGRMAVDVNNRALVCRVIIIMHNQIFSASLHLACSGITHREKDFKCAKFGGTGTCQRNAGNRVEDTFPKIQVRQRVLSE